MSLNEGDSSSAVDVSLDEIGTLTVNQRINIVAKVTRVCNVSEVKSKKTSKVLQKQDRMLCDSEGSSRIV